MTRELKTLVKNMTYTEAPRWHDERLWFADFYTHRVISVAEDGSDIRVEAEVPQQPSGLGWLPDGRLLVVSSKFGSPSIAARSFCSG
jgi:sugar lactone lactonase YvrE